MSMLDKIGQICGNENKRGGEQIWQKMAEVKMQKREREKHSFLNNRWTFPVSFRCPHGESQRRTVRATPKAVSKESKVTSMYCRNWNKRPPFFSRHLLTCGPGCDSGDETEETMRGLATDEAKRRSLSTTTPRSTPASETSSSVRDTRLLPLSRFTVAAIERRKARAEKVRENLPKRKIVDKEDLTPNIPLFVVDPVIIDMLCLSRLRHIYSNRLCPRSQAYDKRDPRNSCYSPRKNRNDDDCCHFDTPKAKKEKKAEPERNVSLVMEDFSFKLNPTASFLDNKRPAAARAAGMQQPRNQ